jgi:hypothetical protein
MVPNEGSNFLSTPFRRGFGEALAENCREKPRCARRKAPERRTGPGRRLKRKGPAGETSIVRKAERPPMRRSKYAG